MWRRYIKKTITEMREYVPHEDLTGISVSPVYLPKKGDMIARDPNNISDMWLVSAEYFEYYYPSKIGEVENSE